ncbi:hypothetical protein [Dactylosporangium salmoneum]|uniref:hypothetical protein n=1 Tax=Dactylosporangium salmoneum TaxID=53361 RepID=UPI0031D5E6C4
MLKHSHPAIRALAVGLVLVGVGGCAGHDPEGAATSHAVDGSSTAAARPDAALRKLKYDCGTIMPKTTALMRTTEVLTDTYNEPHPGAMPTTEAQWQSKNFDSYPGTVCGWGAGDSTATADGLSDQSSLEVQILQPGDWYRDHVLFLDEDGGGGTAFSCSPTTLTGAVRATWCATAAKSPIYNYAADLGVALVEVKVNTDYGSHPIDGAALKRRRWSPAWWDSPYPSGVRSGSNPTPSSTTVISQPSVSASTSAWTVTALAPAWTRTFSRTVRTARMTAAASSERRAASTASARAWSARPARRRRYDATSRAYGRETRRRGATAIARSPTATPPGGTAAVIDSLASQAWHRQPRTIPGWLSAIFLSIIGA